MHRRPFLFGLLGAAVAAPLLSRMDEFNTQTPRSRYGSPILDRQIYLFDAKSPEATRNCLRAGHWPPRQWRRRRSREGSG